MATRKNQMIRNTCSECKEPFFANRVGALYCSNKCKQKAYRKHLLIKAQEKKFQLSMEEYALYNHICERVPELIPMLAKFLSEYDKQAFNDAMHMISVTQLRMTEVLRG